LIDVRIQGIALAMLVACTADAPPAQTPITVPVAGNVKAVVDRWTPSCPNPAPIYSAPWDSTLADTAVIFAAPLNADTIASIFGVSRAHDGHLWFDSQGRGGEAFSGTDSVEAGRWRVIAGQYEQMSYVDDIDLPTDTLGRISPEHYVQGWLYAYAPTSDSCAVVVSWRTPMLGSYRGPRYNAREIQRDSLVAFAQRITWREPPRVD
jgi:hypothetical protein